MEANIVIAKIHSVDMTYTPVTLNGSSTNSRADARQLKAASAGYRTIARIRSVPSRMPAPAPAPAFRGSPRRLKWVRPMCWPLGRTCSSAASAHVFANVAAHIDQNPTVTTAWTPGNFLQLSSRSAFACSDLTEPSVSRTSSSAAVATAAGPGPIQLQEVFRGQ